MRHGEARRVDRLGYEPGLVEVADRLGLAEGRHASELDPGLCGKEVDGPPKHRFAVAEVGAESHERTGHSMKVPCGVVSVLGRADRRPVRVAVRLGVVSLFLALATGVAHAAVPSKAGSAYLPGPVSPAGVLQSSPASGSFLVELDRLRAPVAAPLLRAAGGVRLSRDLQVWRVPRAGLETVAGHLQRAGLLRAVEPDRALTPHTEPAFTDPLFPSQWWRPRVRRGPLQAPGPAHP